MNSDPRHVANAYNIGAEILRSLGIDPRESMVRKIVITIEASKEVTVEITKHPRVGEMLDVAEDVSHYTLVPKDDGK